MQTVICIIQGNEVGSTVEIDDQPVDPQDQVDDSAADEVAADSRHGPSHQVASDTEEQMHGIVQVRDLEDSQQLGLEVVAGT